MSQSGLGPGGRLGIPPLRLPDAGGHAAAPRPRPATLPIPGIGRAGALPRLTRAAWLTPRGTQASPASWPGHVHAREGEQLCIATHSRFVRAVSPRSVPHALRRLRAATLRRGRRRRLETTADSEVGRTGWPRAALPPAKAGMCSSRRLPSALPKWATTRRGSGTWRSPRRTAWAWNGTSRWRSAWPVSSTMWARWRSRTGSSASREGSPGRSAWWWSSTR